MARLTMPTIVAALAFLTRLPVARGGDVPGSPGAAAFGLVGAGMGIVAAIPVLLAGERAPLLAGLLAVAILAIGSGGLHLDGLADTFDALVAHGGDRAERARRDPAIGAAGAVALVLLLGLEAAAIGQLAAGQSTGPLTAPLVAGAILAVAASWGRAVAVVAAVAGRGRIGATGLAAGFASVVRGRDALLAAAVPVVLAVVLAMLARDPAMAAGLAAGLALGLATAALVVRLRGGLDGDGLGAAVELAEAATLVVTALAVAGLGGVRSG
jgi:adenosylcobinamide-GDP ribazoletransferase